MEKVTPSSLKNELCALFCFLPNKPLVEMSPDMKTEAGRLKAIDVTFIKESDMYPYLKVDTERYNVVQLKILSDLESSNLCYKHPFCLFVQMSQSIKAEE